MLFAGFIIVLLFSSPRVAAAQEQTQVWTCLSAVHCRADKPESAACAKKHPYRGRVSVRQDTKPLPNLSAVFVEAVHTAEGRIFTTGVSSLDVGTFGVDNATRLKNIPNVEYNLEEFKLGDGVTDAANPTAIDAAGNAGPWERQSTTKISTEREFFTLQYTDNPTVSNREGGQQQATFGVAETSQTCVSIRWDPYGRVFDSASLEPVMGATVTLLKRRDGGSFTQVSPSEVLGNFTNPISTLEDGMFSFLVEDGVYKLVVTAPNYIFSKQSDGPAPKLYESLFQSLSGHNGR